MKLLFELKMLFTGTLFKMWKTQCYKDFYEAAKSILVSFPVRAEYFLFVMKLPINKLSAEVLLSAVSNEVLFLSINLIEIRTIDFVIFAIVLNPLSFG